MAASLAVAYDTNTFRSEDLIPFLIKNQKRFHVFVPAIVYAERGYSFILNGDAIEAYDAEIASYRGTVISLTAAQIAIAIKLAHSHRKTLPFRDHSRDYLIAGQCQGAIDVFISYNIKHFDVFDLSPTRIVTPEEFIEEFALL